MKRIAAGYIVVEAVALGLYWFALYGWLSAKPVGRYAFPGSPDWSFQYSQSLIHYVWLAGAGFGLSVGGIALGLVIRTQPTRLRLVQGLLSVLLALSVVGGWVLESST
jgi:hypothetical protein